jgi:zinc D-Ala-D-Ala carboxypeptidase
MRRLTKAFLAVILIALLTSFQPTSQAVDIPIHCFHLKKLELSQRSVISGCLKNELSLGSGGIPISNTVKYELDQTFYNRFLAAQAVAKQEGITLTIASGFRSLERQKYLFERALIKYGNFLAAAKWVAPPEISRHPKGLAIDVNYPNDSISAKWLEENGSKFGICRVFENEWWHFEPLIAPGWKCPKLLKDATALLE